MNASRTTEQSQAGDYIQEPQKVNSVVCTCRSVYLS